ncbi:MAG TPA: extracellular solute-binding protein [Nitrososphaera sp.]|nr:extracellular solute-binding protein [Nitrososphaera sp.]
MLPLQNSIKIAIVAIVGALAIVFSIDYATYGAPGPKAATEPIGSDIAPAANATSVDLIPDPSTQQKKREVVLTAILTGDRWDALLKKAEERYESRHPDTDLKVEATIVSYDESRSKLLESLRNGTSVDFISLDQIWLGEFADEGLLVDISTRTEAWGRASDWYQANWDGGLHNGRVYAVWAWTDVRGMWYWKDMLQRADVDPSSLRTWDGYIESSKKLRAALGDDVIEPIHLVGADHSPDMWYPYLWMLGGNILEQREGHPTKGAYWFPAYNGTEGVRALEFLKDQVDAGIVPQREHNWGSEFANRSFTVMLEGSWLPGEFSPEAREDFEANVGFLPLFPVPHEGEASATLMGGWLFAIPQASNNKEGAWEFLTTMLEPDVITTILKQDGYLPTQIPIGEGKYAPAMRDSLVYYDELTSMLSIGRVRPNIVEYPEIAGHIRDAINEVYSGEKLPQQALDDAAARSAESLGWLT